MKINYVKSIPKKKKPKMRLKLEAGYGKVILFGEHAVVYGSHAIATPIPLAIEAYVERASDIGGVHLLIPRWGIEEKLRKKEIHKYSIYKALEMIIKKLDLGNEDMRLEIFPHIPIAMGLGSSAALAVSIIRALSKSFKLNLSDEEVNALAFESEQIIHGNTSGLDNTLATFGEVILYKNGVKTTNESIKISQPIPLVIGLTGIESLTSTMVGKVKKSWEKNKPLYDGLFKEIDQISLQAVNAIQKNDFVALGELMNINQGLLNALQVSSKEIEELIEIARNNGALGAKLTGAGGGGAIIALCPEDSDRVVRAIQKAGYEAMISEIS